MTPVWSWLDRYLRPGPIVDGARHSTLISLAGKLRYRGTEERKILSVLREVNRDRCVPPLADTDLRVLARAASSRPASVADQGPVGRGPHTHRWHFWNLETPGPWEGVECNECSDPIVPLDLADVPRLV